MTVVVAPDPVTATGGMTTGVTVVTEMIVVIVTTVAGIEDISEMMGFMKTGTSQFHSLFCYLATFLGKNFSLLTYLKL